MGANSDVELFRVTLRDAVDAACREWRYPAVPDSHLAAFDTRIPLELQAQLGAGIRSGAIDIDGFYFRARGLPSSKGPYKLVGRSDTTGAPQPHWEYLVQLGEYIRLVRLYAGSDLTIGFEDGLMDVTVRHEGRLLWCVEVKEKARKLAELQAAFERYRDAVPLAPDRGNDGLRKSKYLVRHRPPYLSLLALGTRVDYAVTYPNTTAFELTPLGNSTVIETALRAELDT
jgi:hypothetical protein